jgi:hypothetical protein
VPPYLTECSRDRAPSPAYADPLAGALGPLFEPPEFQWPGIDVIAPVAEHFRDGLLLDKIGPCWCSPRWSR